MIGKDKMQRPKMILLDYGQTLVNEAAFDGVKGTEAVLKYAVKNKYHLSAAQVQAEAEKINKELGIWGQLTSNRKTRMMFVKF